MLPHSSTCPPAGVQVHSLRNPSLLELTAAMQAQHPSLLYLSSGIQVVSTGAGIDNISLRSLEFKGTKGAPRSRFLPPLRHSSSDAVLIARALRLECEAWRTACTAALLRAREAVWVERVARQEQGRGAPGDRGRPEGRGAGHAAD